MEFAKNARIDVDIIEFYNPFKIASTLSRARDKNEGNSIIEFPLEMKIALTAVKSPLFHILTQFMNINNLLPLMCDSLKPSQNNNNNNDIKISVRRRLNTVKNSLLLPFQKIFSNSMNLNNAISSALSQLLCSSYIFKLK